jgi:cystinosin
MIAVGLILSFKKFLNWLDFLYMLSYIKLVMTIVKYIPQVYLNYVRKSTVGWNVYNVILDFIGGLFSTAQLFLDSWITGHWSGISGFAIKLGLGIVSIFFDIVFLLQHFLIYKKPKGVEAEAKNKTKELDSINSEKSKKAEGIQTKSDSYVSGKKIGKNLEDDRQIGSIVGK